METIRVSGKDVQLDIAEELVEYEWRNPRWTSDKLIASSPFRDDRAPSFYVNLTGDGAGTWGDSGAIDDESSRGGFVQLIALLRDTGYEEACEYLLEKYGGLFDIKEGKPIRISNITLPEEVRKNTVLSDDIVTQAVSPYMINRGITADVQAKYGIGYGATARGYTAIPWHDTQGRIANVKYRSTSGRGFFYERDATPISRLVYGLHLAEESAVICEGEIDAMSWEVAGINAIAVGGAHFNRNQVEILKRSNIKRLYLGGDNDEQGRKLNRIVEDEMRGYVELYTVDYGQEKDANDVLLRQGVQEMWDMFDNSNPIRTLKIRV